MISTGIVGVNDPCVAIRIVLFVDQEYIAGINQLWHISFLSNVVSPQYVEISNLLNEVVVESHNSDLTWASTCLPNN